MRIRDESTPEARAMWAVVDSAPKRRLPDWMEQHVTEVAAEWRARLVQRMMEEGR